MLMQPVAADARLLTPRLELAPSHPDDAEALFPLFDNWEVVRHLSQPAWPQHIGMMQGFLARMQQSQVEGSEVAWVIRHEGASVGIISHRWRPANPQSVPGVAAQTGAGPNLGWWLGQPYWNRGLISEAVVALCRHLFLTTATPAIYSGALRQNGASLRVQAKAGFVPDRDDLMVSRPLGRELPHLATKLTRERWLALQPG
jgi:RimJ/RimL family protein N-acetyltransferase